MVRPNQIRGSNQAKEMRYFRNKYVVYVVYVVYVKNSPDQAAMLSRLDLNESGRRATVVTSGQVVKGFGQQMNCTICQE